MAIAREHKLYNTYDKMKSRCLYENDSNYHKYGARGISVCNRWLGYNGFWRFLDDMGERPEGMTLDRIDNNGDYTPENCRWANIETQNNNRRDNKKLTFNGKTMNLPQWARELGIKRSTLAQRIYVYGWTPEQALIRKRG
jgi:hypothetical protein